MPMTCIMTPSPARQQHLIDMLSMVLIIILLVKRIESVCIVVKPGGLTCAPSHNDDAFEYVDQVKYIGVLLYQDVKDDVDMTRHFRSFYVRYNVIFY